MARSFTLSTLETRVRTLADQTSTTYTSQAEVFRCISNAYAELYDILLDAQMGSFESTDTITAGTGGTHSYALHATYYGTIKVEFQDSSGCLHLLEPINVLETGRFAGISNATSVGYRRIGSNLRLYPTPVTGETYIHTYAPVPADLTTGSDSVDGVSGWEEYIVVDAAIQLMIREESNPDQLVQRKMQLLDRIEKKKANRHLGRSFRIADTRRQRPLDAADWRTIRSW